MHYAQPSEHNEYQPSIPLLSLGAMQRISANRLYFYFS